jgi:hypothetical protein
MSTHERIAEILSLIDSVLDQTSPSPDDGAIDDDGAGLRVEAA